MSEELTLSHLSAPTCHHFQLLSTPDPFHQVSAEYATQHQSCSFSHRAVIQSHLRHSHLFKATYHHQVPSPSDENPAIAPSTRNYPHGPSKNHSNYLPNRRLPSPLLVITILPININPLNPFPSTLNAPPWIVCKFYFDSHLDTLLSCLVLTQLHGTVFAKFI